MKQVKCNYEGCGDRRAHWTMPDVPREHRLVEVPDEHNGDVFCSLECAGYAGKFSVRTTIIKESYEQNDES